MRNIMSMGNSICNCYKLKVIRWYDRYLESDPGASPDSVYKQCSRIKINEFYAIKTEHPDARIIMYNMCKMTVGFIENEVFHVLTVENEYVVPVKCVLEWKAGPINIARRVKHERD